MERLYPFFRRCAIAALAFCAVLLFSCAALAEGRHTVVLSCGGGGDVGTLRRGRKKEAVLAPGAGFATEEGETISLEEMLALPDFRLECAALRCTVTKVSGYELCYSLACGHSVSAPRPVRIGRNLWDVTETFSAWLKDRKQEMKITPVYQQAPWGMAVKDGSVSLQLTFTTSARLPELPMDRVRYDALYDASLSMLEEGSAFITRYDDTADSLMEAKLPLGVPYYYAGRSEEKFLNRYFPSTTTRYYLDSHMYFCGLDCVGMTRLVYEKSGLERHPSIVDILHAGVFSEEMKGTDPDRWPMYLQPGDLLCVEHGTYHVMMYLGTLRMFGWNERTAGDAAFLLDSPLVIHCGGNPFYYDRYQTYIEEKGYRNTMPPDGGVTVSVIRQTDADAPFSRDVFWGKHFGWYEVDGQPLLVFRLDDCTDMAWYGPEKQKLAE